jgi:SEC-C motif-containing protein
MRSRYTAFVVGNVDWIVDTHDPRTRNVEREAIAHWIKRAEWMGLRILSTEEGGPDDRSGIVIFEATYFDGVRKRHLERSSFRQSDGRWFYVNGSEPQEDRTPRRVERVGRNEPCPCGSGRKFKKCCGRA